MANTAMRAVPDPLENSAQENLEAPLDDEIMGSEFRPPHLNHCFDLVCVFAEYSLILTSVPNANRDGDQNDARLCSEDAPEELTEANEAHLEEWMELVNKYKADATLRRHNEFCTF
jgi:hypothetical protein